MSNPVREADKTPEDAIDTHLRPQRLEEFIGQSKAKQNLRIFIEAAKSRGEALDHVLFAGPPGLGKTTLAQIMSRELGVNFKATRSTALTRRLRKCFIPRWRISSSTSSSAKVPPPAR